MAAFEERVYKRIKEGALSEVNKRLDGIDGRFDEHGKLIAENMRATGELRRVAQTLVTDVRAIRADMR